MEKHKHVYIFAELHKYSSHRIYKNVVSENTPLEWWNGETTQHNVAGNKLFRWVLLEDYPAREDYKEGWTVLANF